MRLVMLLFILIVDCSALQLVQVVFKGNWAVVPDHRVPLWNDAHVSSTLVMGDGAIIMSVINMEAPSTILPQGAIPFGMVGFFITAFEAVREGGALALVTLVFGNCPQLEAIFALNVAPLILR